MRLPFLLLALLSIAVSARAQSDPILCHASQSTFGLAPVLFDDFAYDASWTPSDRDRDPSSAPDSTSSLYGSNWWQTSTNDSLRAKAWYRYNRYDLPSNEITATDGEVWLRIPARASERSRDAAVSSSFLTRLGTYAARIWLTPAEPGEQVIQAFWLIAPALYTFETSDGREITWSAEVDAEFNAFFHATRGPLMDASIKRSRIESELFDQLEGILSCVGPDGERAADCQRADGTSLLEGRWVTALITVRPDGIAYQAIVDDAQGQSVRAGSVDGTPLVLEGAEYVPQRALSSIVSLHDLTGGQDLPHDFEMGLDWFLHSPCQDLTLGDVLSAVDSLRTRQLTRVNTTRLPTEVREPTARESHTARISGPTRLRYGRTATWRADASPRGTRFYAAFRYRLIGEDGRPGEWIASDRPTITLTAERPLQGAEFITTFRDHFFPHGDRRPDNHSAAARHTVTFHGP